MILEDTWHGGDRSSEQRSLTEFTTALPQVATTGKSLRLDVSSNAHSYSHFKHVLSLESNITLPHQILLCGPPYRAFDRTQFQDVSNKAKHLFLYDKRIIQGNEADLETLQDQDETVPGPVAALGKPTESATTALVAGGNPLDIALSNYELQFLHLLRNSEAYANAADARFHLAQRLFEELHVQHRARHGAVQNLGDHAEPLRQAFHHVEKAVAEQRVANEALLEEFTPALSALSSVSLHPALVKDDSNVRTLADCVPVEKEKAWLEQCRIGHQQIFNQLEAARLDFSDVDNDARDLMKTIQGSRSDSLHDFSPLPAKEELKQHLETLRSISESQQQHYRENRQEYERVKATVLKQLQSPSSMNASTTALETCRGFEELLQRKQNLFVEWTTSDRTSCRACAAMVDHKRSSSRKLGVCLQIISKLQYKIQLLHQKLGVLRTMKERQDMDFRHLEHIIYLKDAYEAFLVEVARRRTYAKSFSDKIGEASRNIGEFRNVEVERREKFWRHHGHHLPPVFYTWMPSLAKPPPYFSPEAPASEGLLPEVQMAWQHVAESGPSETQLNDSTAMNDEHVGSVILEPEDDAEEENARERQRQIQAALEYENLSLKAEVHQLKARLARLEQQTVDEEIAEPMQEAKAVMPLVQDMKEEEAPSSVSDIDVDLVTRESLVQLVQDVVVQPEERIMLLSTLQSGFDRGFLGTLLLQIRENVQELKVQLDQSIAANEQRISYGRLEVGDVALFLPTQPSPEDNQYRPFVAGGCNMFMHPQAVSAARQQNNSQKPDFVVGKIFQKERFNQHEHADLRLTEDLESCWVAQVEILFSAFGPVEADAPFLPAQE